MSSPSFSEVDLVRSLCKDSFYDFFCEFWDVFVPDQPLSLNWHIKLLCDELQAVAERVFSNKPKEYDLIINISPGSTKSSIASIAYPAWLWTHMPSCRVLAGSHTWELVQDLARKSRDIILTQDRPGGKPSYQECWPNPLKEDQNTKGYYMNEAGGFRKGVTVGGKSPVGFHAHVIIIDDPIDPEKAKSKAAIQSANAWMNDTLPSRKVNKSVTPTILIMQRLHQNDPTGNWLTKQGAPVKHLSLPADCNEFEVKPPELRKCYDKSGLMDPERIPRAVLNEVIAKGVYTYASQYGQDPVPSSGGMFKTKKFRVVKALPSHVVRTVRYWDRASTEDDGDWTVGVKFAVDSLGQIYVADVVRGQWDTNEREQIILQTAKADGRNCTIGVEQEPGSSGKDSARATARMLNGYKVILDAPTGEKADRAEPYSSQVNAGNIALVQANWNFDYVEELKFFPKGTYDDQVDASAGGFNILTGKRVAGGLW